MTPELVTTPELVVTVGVICLTSLIWLIRLEGRVNTHDREHQAHRERCDEIREGQVRQYDELRADLAYIRARIDAAIGPTYRRES
jgi:hypothetical protein